MVATTNQENIEHLIKLLRSMKVAMLTTVAEDGSLRSRPMAPVEVNEDGTLWFFTQASSPKVDEVQQEQQVNVSFSEANHSRFVSVSGKGTMVYDREKMKALWNPIYKAWFPDGLEDPQISLLKVCADNAEYWDVQSTTMVQIIGFVKAITTGQTYQPGENKKVDFASSSTLS